MSQEDLRSKVIRVAYHNPDLRPHLLPLLKSAGAFEDAIEGRTFKSDATNRNVKFKSLPPEQQKKIREEWAKREEKNKDDPKSVKLTDVERDVARGWYNKLPQGSIKEQMFGIHQDLTKGKLPSQEDVKDLLDTIDQVERDTEGTEYSKAKSTIDSIRKTFGPKKK